MREPYYTNSSQLPVGHTDDLFEMCELQDKLQCLYTGGCVEHLYLGEKICKEQVKTIIKSIFNKFKMPYISITPTFSICSEHGYFNGEIVKCPKCDKDMEVYSRIVGYIRPINQWNKGKAEEYSKRKLYKIKKDTPE